MNKRTAYQVDDYIAAEVASPLGRHLADVHDSFGIICVDVKDGGVDHSGHICAVR